MELICTRCDGLGQERRNKATMHPAQNVAGWHTEYHLPYYWRPCEPCAGTGYRPSGVSVPGVPLTQATR